MVATKIQLLVAIGVALSIVQAGPIGYDGNKPSFNNKVTLLYFSSLLILSLHYFKRFQCSNFLISCNQTNLCISPPPSLL
jgi:hypothetical protein